MYHYKNTFSIVPLITLLLLVSPAASQVQSSWTGGGDNLSWTDGNNWSTEMAPGNTSTDFFNVEIPSANPPASVILESVPNVRIDSLSVAADQLLTIGDATKLIMHGTSARPESGFLTNNGRIVVGPNDSVLNITGNSVIDGAGTISLAGSYSNVFGFDGAPLRTITNTGNTIEGFGAITFASTHFTNESLGLINATLVGEHGQGISLSTTFGGGVITPSRFTNRGTLQASNGSNFRLFGFHDFANQEGSIVAEDDSSVWIDSTTITGGNLDTNGSGVFNINNTGLRNLVLNADVQVSRFATLYGSIENRKSIRAERGTITSTENVVLTGGGELVLDRTRLTHDFSSSTETFTNVDNTVKVLGYASIVAMKFINQANGVVDSSGSLSLNADQNHGVMRANAGSSILISSVDSSELEFQNSGKLEVGDGGRTEINGTVINTASGVVSGNGALQSEGFVNRGTLDIVGALFLESDVILEQTSSLSIDLRENSIDLLSVDGSLQLAGALTITLDGLTPTTEDVFDIVHYDLSSTGNLLGEFAGFSDDATYLSADGMYSFVIDYNLDPLSGRVVLRNFQSLAVPEPATLGPMLIAGILILTRRKRGRRMS